MVVEVTAGVVRAIGALESAVVREVAIAVAAVVIPTMTATARRLVV